MGLSSLIREHNLHTTIIVTESRQSANTTLSHFMGTGEEALIAFDVTGTRDVICVLLSLTRNHRAIVFAQVN